MNPIDRRSMLTGAGMAGFAAALPGNVFAQAMDASKGGNAIPEVVNTGAPTDPRPKHHIKFAVIGLDHNHIYGMTAAVIRGGGELVALYAKDPGQIASFRSKFGDVKLARSEAEILDDPSIQLVAG
ncbi:MAG: gfo/Idh/MocA family oxidoreductase, partial [Sphingomonas bacterium]